LRRGFAFLQTPCPGASFSDGHFTSLAVSKHAPTPPSPSSGAALRRLRRGAGAAPAVAATPLEEPIEERPGSAQSRESAARDLAAQPELLAQAAELLRRRQEREAEDAVDEELTQGQRPQRRQRTNIFDLPGFDDLASGNVNGNGGGNERRQECRAQIRLAKHLLKGDRLGQLSGKPFVAYKCIFAENEALAEVFTRVLKVRAKWFPDWDGDSLAFSRCVPSGSPTGTATP